jgi:hypothetical protein
MSEQKACESSGSALALMNSQSARDAPRVSYDELVKNVPREGSTTTLTDVRYCTKVHFSSFYDPQSPGNVMCVPAYSASLQQEPQPGQLTLILVIRDKRILGELWSHPGRTEFTGQVYESAGRLEQKDQEALEKEYPGIQLANCRVLIGSWHDPTADWRYAQPWVWFAAVLVVAGCIILGCWAWLRAAKKQRGRESN